MGPPDLAARRAIAAVHARHFQVDVPPALLEVIAAATDGMNGDEIRSIFRDACVAEKLHGIAPDARALGRLVGQIRRAAQEREASTSSRQTSRSPAGRRDAPPAPSGAIIPLTRGGPAAPTGPAPAPLAPPNDVVDRADSPEASP
jgi:transitional endoplasmic reticulum ATPase